MVKFYSVCRDNREIRWWSFTVNGVSIVEMLCDVGSAMLFAGMLETSVSLSCLFRWTSVFTADAFCSTGKYMVLFVIQRHSWCFSWGSYLFYEGNISVLSQNIIFIHVQSQSCRCMPSHRYQWWCRFLMKSFPKDISVMDILCILCKQVFL